jgi:hypothetical protein
MTDQPHRVDFFHPKRPTEGCTINVTPAAPPRSRAKLVDAGLMGPGCGNPTCPCETHSWQQACQEWQGIPGDSACPRCGWIKGQHTI